MIDYSNEFKDRAKDIFPKWEKLHRAIDRNEEAEVRIALDSIRTEIPAGQIFQMIKDGKVSKLYNKARFLKRVYDLQNLWYTEFDKFQEENIPFEHPRIYEPEY